jgi:hypothetical protein
MSLEDLISRAVTPKTRRGDLMIDINPLFTKLVTALKTAVENGEGALDKEATSHDDLFDAFRLSLMHWRRRRQGSRRG